MPSYSDNGSLTRSFMKYVSLSVLGTLGVSGYILADTFFVSKGLGSAGLAALNIAIPVYNFIHGTGLMLGMGGATLFSLAAEKRENANRFFTGALCLGAAFSAVFLLICAFAVQPLSLLLGANGETLQMTSTYIRWLLIFSPAFIANDIMLCFVRNDNGPQLSMAAMITGSFSNILLDYIFIFPLKMGIFGAVFATGLSPVISLAVISPHFFGKKSTLRPVAARPKLRESLRLLSLGAPSLISQVSSAVVLIVFNIVILRLCGNTGVAAYGVIANISLIVTAVFTGVSQGAQPIFSACHARRENASLKAAFRLSMLTVLVISAAVYIVLFVFAGEVTAAFNSENNASLAQIAVFGIRIYFLSNLFAGYNIVLAVAFTSCDIAAPAQALSLLRGFFVIIPLALIFSHFWGMTGVWLSYPVTEAAVAAAGAAVSAFLRRRSRVQNQRGFQ